MLRLHLSSIHLKFFLWAAALSLLVAAAFSRHQPNQDENVESSSSVGVSEEAGQSESTNDDATRNLHRWGAVTLFHGLPSDRVNAITEDASGTLWFGTDNGLVRYDGRRTQLVGGLEGGGAVLPSQRVRALRRDGAGGLWVGTDAGAARYSNRKIEVVAETRSRAVTGFAESPQGVVALTTAEGEVVFLSPAQTDIAREQGRYAGALAAAKLDRTTVPLLGFNDPSGAARGVELTSIEFTKTEDGGEWWVGSRSRGALVVSERGAQRELAEAATRAPRPYFVSAVYAADGYVWLGAQAGRGESGLWFHHATAPSPLMRFPLPTGGVTALHGGAGDLWVGTEDNGAYLLRGGSVIEHLTFESTAGGLRSNHINSVYRDREGVVWFGTDRGVSRYDRDSFRAATVGAGANSNFVRSLLVAANGDVWAGTNRGLFRLDAGHELGPWNEIAEVGSRAVYTLLEEPQGTVWAGTEAGLYKFAGGSQHGQVIRLREEADKEGDLAGPGTASVRELGVLDGKIFATSYPAAGYWVENDRLIPASPRIAESLRPFMHGRLLAGARMSAAFSHNDEHLRTFGKLPAFKVALGDPHNIPYNIWLGTEEGLYANDKAVLVKVVDKVDVQALLVTDGMLYCATRNAGLFKIEIASALSKQPLVTRFDTEQGLPSQQVFALAEDKKKGVIWIGTNRGVVRHQPNPVAPRLEARRLVADQVYDGDYLSAGLRFPATQTSFLLEVAALGSRTFPSQFQYEYALSEERLGSIKNVRTPDSQFVLEGMKPGRYTITVRALSRDLVYSEPLAVRLWIAKAPLPWSTVLLGALLGVAVVAGAWAYRSQRRTARANLELERTNEELRETRIRLARETEAERSRIARDLHDQTLGDLRHLLVLTDQLPAPPAESADGADAETPTPALLRRNIEGISREIRQICEDLSPSVLDNIGFVPSLEWALTNAVAGLPAEEKFNYRFVAEPDLEERLRLGATERIQLYRIVQEALNNVCRHARARNVSLTVGVENGRDLVIVVKDDGVGLRGAPEADDRVTKDGTGHGMANIRSRANLIGAEAAWLDADAGCHFEVRKAGAVV
jgi:signal transduction histidine kinase